MTTQKDIATQTGALCVGAAAFIIGDPSGGTLLATPLTALAAIGITLKSGCAGKAAAKAEAAVLDALARGPEYDDKTLEAARALLTELPHAAKIDPKGLVAVVHGQDFETAATREILRALGLTEADGALHTLMTQVTLAGLTATKRDKEFRAALTLEMLIETARKQGYEIELAEDTNRKVTRVLQHLEDSSLSDLREAANFFEDAPDAGASRFELMAFLKAKAEDIARLLREREALPPALPRLENVRAAVTEAVRSFRLDDAEAMLDAAREIVKAETLRPALEANATLDEQKAEILILRGRVDEAALVFSAAADSFASVDPLEPARRRLRYEDMLYAHGLRYGGQGLALSQAMIEAAIAACPREADARLWAAAQNALAIALADQGSRTSGAAGTALLAEAVAAYRDALIVHTRQDHPVDWAMTQNNLGIALRNQGTRTGGAAGTALLAEAVAAYRDALAVYTRQDHPVDWAMTQNKLGVALADQGTRTGGPAGTALLAEAVAAYRDALTVRTREDHPVQWATTQNNLGNALAEQGIRTGGAEGTALLAEAVAAYRDALTVRTRQDHPVDWAITQENLALAERARADHEASADPRPHLEAALAHVEAALEVFDTEHMPYDHGTASALRDDLRTRLAGGGPG